MKPDEAYCRLCAVIKHNGDLLDLKSDQDELATVVRQLTRVNVKMDFDYDVFPSTVCFQCLEALERSSGFIKDVEQAQVLLCSIFMEKEMKSETVDTELVPVLDCQFYNKNESTAKESYIINSSELPDGQASNISGITNNYGCETSETPSINKMLSESTFNDDRSHTQNNDDNCTPTKVEDTVRKMTDNVHAYISSLLVAVEMKELPEPATKETIPLPPTISAWADYPWNCAHCDSHFTALDQLKTHAVERHSHCNSFKCSDCGKQEYLLDLFLRHIRCHNTDLKYICHKCNISFINSMQLYKHECAMSTDIDVQFNCPGCNNPFYSISELEAHMHQYFVKPEPSRHARKKHLCNICMRYYKSIELLNSHKETHYKKFVCDHCGVTYTSKGALISHMLKHYDYRPHRCDFCKLRFKARSHLKGHITAIHSSEKPFTCDKCGKSFSVGRYFRKHLRQHLLIDTGSKPYMCTYCDKKFLLKSGLEVHIRQHTGARPYCCQYCGKTFVNCANYSKHVKRKHASEKKT